MDKVIVTGLLVIGSVTAALVVILTIGPSVSSSSQSVLETQREASVRIKTDIEVITVASNVAGTLVDAWVKNVGVAPIMGLSLSDVFLVTSNTRYDAMVYATSGDNTWTELPSGSSWNRGETLHIAVSLPIGNPLASGNHTIRFSTPNGILAERVFSR
jgi:archaellum component FlaG (FlaF/FlaG flagellin family)